MRINSGLLILCLVLLPFTGTATEFRCDQPLLAPFRTFYRPPFLHSVLAPYSSFVWSSNELPAHLTPSPDWTPVNFHDLPDWYEGPLPLSHEQLDSEVKNPHAQVSVVYLVYSNYSIKILGEAVTPKIIDAETRSRCPTGALDESQRPLPPKERATALALVEQGHCFISVPEQRGGVRTPDGALWLRQTNQTILVEFKDPQKTATDETIVRTISRSIARGGQAPYMVIRAPELQIERAQALRIARRLIGIFQERWSHRYPDRLYEVRIISANADRIFVFYTLDSILENSAPFTTNSTPRSRPLAQPTYPN